MNKTNYTDEEKIEGLKELYYALSTSLIPVVSIDIATRNNELTDKEKIAEIIRLLEGCFTFQSTMKKYNIDAILF